MIFFAATNIGPAPDQMAHRLVRRDPRPPGHRPTRTILHREAKPEPLTFTGDMADHLIPLRTEAGYLRLDARPGFSVSVKELNAAKSGTGNCLKVGRQPRLSHIATDEMKPCFWSTLLGRIAETVDQWIGGKRCLGKARQ